MTFTRQLADGRYLTAMPLFGGRGRLGVGWDLTGFHDNW